MSKNKTAFMLVIAIAMFLLTDVPIACSSIDLPEYDSGWVRLDAAERIGPEILPPLYPSETTFAHNLNTTEVFVYITAKTLQGWIVPFETYGRDFAESKPDPLESWFLISENEIMVRNYFEYEIEVRIRIWEMVKVQPTQPVTPVGGLLLPINIDMREPLSLRISLISTILLVLTTSLIYIKHKKNQ